MGYEKENRIALFGGICFLSSAWLFGRYTGNNDGRGRNDGYPGRDYRSGFV